VDLDALPVVGGIFPALFLATDPQRPDWKRDIDFKPLAAFNFAGVPINL
jgi:hypothetical protein